MARLPQNPSDMARNLNTNEDQRIQGLYAVMETGLRYRLWQNIHLLFLNILMERIFIKFSSS